MNAAGARTFLLASLPLAQGLESLTSASLQTFIARLCGQTRFGLATVQRAIRATAMRGRKKPYTTRGIERIPCVRCGKPSFHQWQICSDNRLFRPLCSKCDVALNRLVLRWVGFKDWRRKLARYKREWGIKP